MIEKLRKYLGYSGGYKNKNYLFETNVTLLITEIFSYFIGSGEGIKPSGFGL